MRVKQTARKSTAPSSIDPRMRPSRGDPVRRSIQILQTKRNSQTPSYTPKREPGTSGGRGKNINNLIKVRPKPRVKQGFHVLKEIKRLQQTYELQIPRAAFHRVVREITQEIAAMKEAESHQPVEFRYQPAALEALQEAAEAYLVRVLEGSYLCTLHCKRVTLMVSDITLCMRLRKME